MGKLLALSGETLCSISGSAPNTGQGHDRALHPLSNASKEGSQAGLPGKDGPELGAPAEAAPSPPSCTQPLANQLGTERVLGGGSAQRGFRIFI